ncbi:hypothetical protein K1719_007270 [Acacia pycnantha]|nr:hypothetical protein K1719_007270 [Acacia pycnantha]
MYDGPWEDAILTSDDTLVNRRVEEQEEGTLANHSAEQTINGHDSAPLAKPATQTNRKAGNSHGQKYEIVQKPKPTYRLKETKAAVPSAGSRMQIEGDGPSILLQSLGQVGLDKALIVNIDGNPNASFEASKIMELIQDTSRLKDLRPPEYWDPNDDVAPDFLDAKGTFVAETQFENQHDGGTGGPSSNFANSDVMAERQADHATLKELDAPDVNYQLLCIQYPNLAANFELKSGLIHLLPKFHGLADKGLVDASSGGAMSNKTPRGSGLDIHYGV